MLVVAGGGVTSVLGCLFAKVPFGIYVVEQDERMSNPMTIIARRASLRAALIFWSAGLLA